MKAWRWGALVATMLLVSAVSGATAATLITGRDVKDGSLTGRDIRDGTLAGREIKNKSLGLADVSRNVRRSMVVPRIPSGMTVTGEELWSFSADTASEFRITVSLPGDPGRDLTHSRVNFAVHASVDDGDPACDGNVEEPTAPPGKVCLYLIGYTTDVSSVAGDAQDVLTRSGFVVRWNDDASNTSYTYLHFSWAYTAP